MGRLVHTADVAEISETDESDFTEILYDAERLVSRTDKAILVSWHVVREIWFPVANLREDSAGTIYAADWFLKKQGLDE